MADNPIKDAIGEEKISLKILGPGLITGASDDDPAGIATYSQAGAQFGFTTLWLMPFLWPFMSAIQEISARIGRTTGRGIGGNLRHHYPAWFSGPIVGLMMIANVFNIGADLGAMGASLQLIVGGNARLYSLLFAMVCVLGAALFSYKRYSGILRWLTLFLLAYIATAFAVHVPWSEALRATVAPSLEFNSKYLSLVVAVCGTTISPYLFFWQASEEAEEVRLSKTKRPLREHPEESKGAFRRIQVDTLAGMLLANTVAWFIMLTCAVTLHQHGITDIDTAEKAALALRPLAGNLAFLLFAGGIIGTGMLAVPVLAGSAAFGLGEEMRRRVGLNYSPKRAPYFYGIFALATMIGVALNFSPINPIRALVWSAIANGVIAVPVMFAMMLMLRNPAVMGSLATRKGWLHTLGWVATLVMTIASVAMFVTMGK